MRANKENNKKIKVLVGLSGGVDSAVAAALLQQQGYNVTGVFIKIWDERWGSPCEMSADVAGNSAIRGIISRGECNWPQERREAMRVAIKLGIPFKTLDLSAEYKKEVADYMVCEYKLGRTPNPDVVCNKTVKFGAFLKWAISQGANFVATGHYVRITDNAQRITQEIINDKKQITNPEGEQVPYGASKFQIPISKFKNTGYQIQNTKYQLQSGVDKTKDQSYFLWQLTQSQLKHCLFPVGGYTKTQVRALARKFGLPNADRKDSQGICFVGKVGLKEFLKKYLKPKRGKILNEKKEVIGWHDGAFFLTIGQRHGFTITAKTSNDAPYYIVGKDVRRNTVTVANIKTLKHKNPAGQADGASIKIIIIHQVSWINEEPKQGKIYQARFRHLQELKVCKVRKLERDKYEIKFNKPQGAVAPGQSLVLYDGDVCVGGGIIKSS